MAGKETIEKTLGPMMASDEMVRTWISSMPKYNYEDRQPVILNFDFQKSGEKMVFVILPKNMRMENLVEISVDEKVMRFSKENGEETGYANPLIITNDQAISLRETGLVDRLKVRFPPRPVQFG